MDIFIENFPPQLTSRKLDYSHSVSNTWLCWSYTYNAYIVHSLIVRTDHSVSFVSGVFLLLALVLVLFCTKGNLFVTSLRCRVPPDELH